MIGKRWFVDDDVDTLYRTLTEVVGVAFHSQSIDTYGDLFLRSDHRCLFVCTLLGASKIVGKCWYHGSMGGCIL